MVLARVAEYLFPANAPPQEQYMQDERQTTASQAMARRQPEVVMDMGSGMDAHDIEAERPPFIHAMFAGGLGGLMGDMLMHSLDTVKTRQQGDPHMPPKYTSMGSTYYTILRQEGVRRGLYGGVTPAFLGSFSGTTIFFGSYEFAKRKFLDSGMNPSIAYFVSGLLADLFASPLYVPSEVLKTRLQLQGRFNNPYFNSGYNYRSTMHAFRTIIRKEGWRELFSGYKATLARDLPFSALQFAFYEKEQQWAKQWAGRKDIGLPLEILTGASAGGLAGVITCPLDVVKTRIQTQLDPTLVAAVNPGISNKTAPAAASVSPAGAAHRPARASAIKGQDAPKRPISTSGPSTALRQHGSVQLDTEKVFRGLRQIYKHEGLAGWFRGVGPRGVWTSIQSGTMLVMYQQLLKFFEGHSLLEDTHDELAAASGHR